MVSVAPHVVEVVPAEVELVGREQLIDSVLLERGPLELEEQQRRLDRRAALLRQLQQRPIVRIGGVGREAQRGVCARAPDQLVDRRELLHRLPQPLGVELPELARIALRERLRARQRLRQPPLDAVAPLPLEQRLEVPRGPLELWIGRVRRGVRGHRPAA